MKSGTINPDLQIENSNTLADLPGNKLHFTNQPQTILLMMHTQKKNPICIYSIDINMIYNVWVQWNFIKKRKMKVFIKCKLTN